jgi:predicted RNase H-like HicB family nuclease
VRYLVVLEKGAESYGAYAPDLPGCVAVGETEEETLSLIRESIGLHVEDLKRRGQPIPQPSSTAQVVEVATA